MTTEKAKNWLHTESEYSPEKEAIYASVFTQGNGYLGLRASHEELGNWGTQGLFLGGVYCHAYSDEFYPADNFFKKRYVFSEEQAKTEGGRYHETLVNMPDPLYIRCAAGGQPLQVWDDGVRDYARTLDVRNGLLTRKYTQQTPRGKLAFQIRRFVSEADHHVIMQEYTVRSAGFRGELAIETGLDGRAYTFSRREIDPQSIQAWGAGLRYLGRIPNPMRSPLSQGKGPLAVRIALSHKITLNGRDVTRKFTFGAGLDTVRFVGATFILKPRDVLKIVKVTTLFTDHDREQEGVDPAAAEKALQARYAKLSFDAALARSTANWRALWARCDIQIDGDDELQKLIRLVFYHLIIGRPRSERYSVTAKTLSGLGYKGLFWWDGDIYIAPFYAVTLPETARNLLRYRFITLDGARANARKLGMAGAKYAWNTSLTGEEMAFTWLPTAALQVHINSDIPYSILNYARITGDQAFLEQEGLEIMLETARYYTTRATRAAPGKWEIRDCAGPDEYHLNIHNNAYTNYLARHHLRRLLELLADRKATAPKGFKALVKRLKIRDAELGLFREIAEGLVIPADPKTGIIEQFEGYNRLAETWERAGATYGGPAANYHLVKGIKQADVLLLLALFPEKFSLRDKIVNWDIYEKFTQHGSSLSPGIYALVAAQIGMLDKAIELLRLCCRWDIGNHNGDSHWGIHSALFGSVFLALVYGFGGVIHQDNVLKITPRLPGQWRGLRFPYRHEGVELAVAVTHDQIAVTHRGNIGRTLELEVAGVRRTLAPGKTVSAPYELILA